ncbi:hypothetical protein JXA85_08065, partial [Candidatus Woesearchaeota archaeon]|nr:hypothetical protein [Candidatus Woesearchaeota archaeon]
PDFCSASAIPGSFVSRDKAKNAWCDSKSGSGSSGKKCYRCEGGEWNGFTDNRVACVYDDCSGDAKCKDSQALTYEAEKYEAVLTKYCNDPRGYNYVCMKCKPGYHWVNNNCVLSGPGQCPSGSTWYGMLNTCVFTCRPDGSTNCAPCLVTSTNTAGKCAGNVCRNINGVVDGNLAESRVMQYYMNDGWGSLNSNGYYCFGQTLSPQKCFNANGVPFNVGTLKPSDPSILCVSGGLQGVKYSSTEYLCNSAGNNQVVYNIAGKSFKCSCSGTTCAWSEYATDGCNGEGEFCFEPDFDALGPEDGPAAMGDVTHVEAEDSACEFEYWCYRCNIPGTSFYADNGDFICEFATCADGCPEGTSVCSSNQPESSACVSDPYCAAACRTKCWCKSNTGGCAIGLPAESSYDPCSICGTRMWPFKPCTLEECRALGECKFTSWAAGLVTKCEGI